VDATVLDVAYLAGSTFAVGSHNGRAAVWTTAYGQQWRPLSGVEAPDADGSEISRTVVWKGAVYGYGRVDGDAAVWRGTPAGDWDLVGVIPQFESAVPAAVAANDTGLLAVASFDDGRTGLWTSDDATHWIRIDPPGNRYPESAALAARGGWFYAAGADCSGACEPIISRSRDGIGWEVVDLPATGNGSLDDIAATSTGLVAVGATTGPGGAPQPLVLRTEDGLVWLESGREGRGPVAGVALQHVSGRGNRVVATGIHINLEDPPAGVVAAVWSSGDGGTTWDRSTVEGAGPVALTPYTPGTRITLVGTVGNDTVAWTGGWDSGAVDELQYATR
jgi:hypothetical protein